MLEDREHAIRERAYAIWERDGRPEGRSLDHWAQAEAEIGIAQAAPAKTVKSRRAHAVNRKSMPYSPGVAAT